MPTLNEKLRKENDALKKQVKASSAKISEIEGKYQDLISKLESNSKEIACNSTSDDASSNSTSCCNNSATLTQVLQIAKSITEDIKQFKNSFVDVQSSVQTLKTKMGEFAQYSRINSLLFHGLKNALKLHCFQLCFVMKCLSISKR